MNLSDLGEFGLIDRLARRLAGASPGAGTLLRGIGDDAALLRLPPGMDAVATIDALVEEVHFRRDWTRPQDLGWKALAVNLSDLGAMGARPMAALVTLAVPPDTEVRWIERLYAGLAECAGEHGCPIAGGDTVRSPRRVMISVAALGAVPEGRAVCREGAKRGDLLCVTGVLGDSGGGLELLQRGAARTGRPGTQVPAGCPLGGEMRPLLDWHFRPRPPVAAGAALAEAGLPTAMLDLSDGLASDLRHLAKASRVGFRVEADRLPISDAARQTAAGLGLDALDWALYGGEDYQLLFTVSPDRFPEVPPALGPLGVTATIIGKAVGRGLTLVPPDGTREPLSPRGFAHFHPEGQIDA